MTMRARPMAGLVVLGSLLLSCSLTGGGGEVAPEVKPTEVQPPPGESEQVSGAYIAIVGPEEAVFDASRDRCAPRDFTDLPVRAFRDAEGRVQMNRSGPSNRRFVGPDLEHLTAECDVVLESLRDPDPSHYADEQWIQALYTEDGQTVHAILHNEENNPEAGTWYQNLTYAVSTDGGATYQQPAPPDNYVASLPYPFELGKTVYGLTAGSNIVKGPDGAYYMVALNGHYGESAWHTCLLRTDDLSDPAAWRAWDGSGFGMTFVNPYQQPDVPAAEHTCPALSEDYTRENAMHESLTYNTFVGRYMLLGMNNFFFGDQQVWGLYYSFSDDLIHWDERQLLLEAPLSAWFGAGGGPDSMGYPVLLDPDSDSRNFETADKTAYVYYARFNYESGEASPDVDLVRFPVEFFTSEAEAQAADVRTRLNLLGVPDDDGTFNLSGNLKTLGGEPVAGAAIDFVVSPTEGEGVPFEYTLTGRVPEGATQANVGVRVNMECGCSANSDLAVYEFSYTEGGGANRVPNGNFAGGLSGYAVWGSAGGVLEPGDQGAGSMLHVTAPQGRDAGINSAQFAVTPGAEFTYTVRARVAPGSRYGGFFGLFFAGVSGFEGSRSLIPLRPTSTVIGSLTTDADGKFVFAGTLPEGPAAMLEARFAGDARYWPTSQQVGR